MRLGVYVGTFDPPHKGHIKVINHLINNNYLDKIIVIPTGVYWDKTNITDIKYRKDMLKIFENESIIIDNKLNNIPNTYLVLRELHKKYDDLYLIIGADNIINFDKWKEYHEIIDNNHIIVIPRDNVNISKYLNKYNKEKFIIVKDFNCIDINSTYIRELIRNKDYLELNKYLNKEVINYIKENDLYK